MDMKTEKPPDTKHVIGYNQELLTEENPQAELLRWHYRIGHLPFYRTKIFALLGKITKKLANMKRHKYKGFIFEAMTKCP